MGTTQRARIAARDPGGDAGGVVHVAARYSFVSFKVRVRALLRLKPFHANRANIIVPRVLNRRQPRHEAL